MGLGPFALLAACAPLEAEHEPVARTVQGVTVGSVITFPSPSATEPTDANGPVSLAAGPNGWFVGFTRRVGTNGLVVRTYNPDWTLAGPAEPVPGANGFGVVSARGSTALAAWNSTAPTRTVNLALLSPSGAVVGTPVSVPALQENIAPALGWTSRGALFAWEGPYGAQRVVRVSRVSDAGALLDGPAGTVFSGDLSTPGTVTMSCLPAQCLVAWMNSNGFSPADTFLRRVGADGVALDAAPARIDTPLRNRFDPAVANDGTNHLVVWHESDGTSPARGVYARRVSGATGAWLDAAPILIRTLPSTSVQDRSTVAWNGSVWGVLTYTTTPWTFAAIGPDGRVVTASRDVPGTGATSSAQMVASRGGWEGVYPDSVYLRRFELRADGTAVRVAVPAQELIGPFQPVLGLTYAGGRFLAHVQEGLWRVTPAGTREGARVPFPGGWQDDAMFNVRGLTASGNRVATHGALYFAGPSESISVRTLDATLTDFGPLRAVARAPEPMGSFLSNAPGSGFLVGLGHNVLYDGSGGGLILVWLTPTGDVLHNLNLPGASGRPVFVSNATETLLAHGVGRPCTTEILLLNGAGGVLAQRDVVNAAGDAGSCLWNSFSSVATNGTTFLFVGAREGLFVTGGGSITLGRRVTWATGDAFAVVWNGSAYVVFTLRTNASGVRELLAQRISPAGDLLDPAGVFVDYAYPIRAGRDVHVAADGAGRTAALYLRYEGANLRAALRILDWNTSGDGGVDAGPDVRADVGTDARIDVTTDVRTDASFDLGVDTVVTPDVSPADRAVPSDARMDVQQTPDVLSDGGTDARPDVAPREDVTLPEDVATDRGVSPSLDGALTDGGPSDAPSDAPAPPRPPESTGWSCSTAVGTHAHPGYAAACWGLVLLAARRRRSATGFMRCASRSGRRSTWAVRPSRSPPATSAVTPES